SPVISSRPPSPDPYYRRALSAMELGDFRSAVEDLAHVVTTDPKYDYHRAAGVLAHALGRGGQQEAAAAHFAAVTETSTLSETQYNYARFLAANGRPAEAREWAQRILAKKPTMPAYMRRRGRPWFRTAGPLRK